MRVPLHQAEKFHSTSGSFVPFHVHSFASNWECIYIKYGARVFATKETADGMKRNSKAINNTLPVSNKAHLEYSISDIAI